MHSPKLKPCPFCGGEARYYPYRNPRSPSPEEELFAVAMNLPAYVVCIKCGAEIARGSYEGAAAAWNRRAFAADCGEIIEILQEMSWGLDQKYDTSPFTSRELKAFIERIRAAMKCPDMQGREKKGGAP